MKLAVSLPDRQGAQHFARAAFAKAQAAIHKKPVTEFLTKDAVAEQIVSRAAASPGTTDDAGWAAELARTALRDYLADLAPYSGASRLISQAVQGVLGNDLTAEYPIRPAGPATASWVGQNGAIPVQAYAFDHVDLQARKLASVLVWSRDLSKRSDADAIFDRMLREDMGASLDAAFFATSAGSDSAHAGLLYGVTPITGYAGGDDVAIQTDLTSLAETVATGGSGQVTFVMAPERLARLRIVAPALVRSNDMVSSAAVPTSRVIAVDAPSLVVAVDPEPDIDASQAAAVHMSSEAAALVESAATADPVRSLWQTGSVSFRTLFDIAFARRRTSAVAYADSVTW